jgi:hypothetical protein
LVDLFECTMMHGLTNPKFVSSTVNSFLLCIQNSRTNSFSQNIIFGLCKVPFVLFFEGPSFTAITKYGSCQNFISESSDLQPTGSPTQTPPLSYLIVVQSVSTNKALGTELWQYNRSVLFGGNVTQPEMTSPEVTSGHSTTGLNYFSVSN